MPKIKNIIYYLLHLQELRALFQWYFGHLPVHVRNEQQESPTLQRCFYFLDKTSRSFSAVIKELNPELLAPICLFYLILRGLDTVEDDMTIPLQDKDPLLRDFHNVLQEDGWTYEGNHVREKDRDLLVNFDVVVTEFKKLKPRYQTIIADITKRMGNGMADFASKSDLNVNGIISTKDYELYCHYVAGLVGEGLTRLFVGSRLANPALLKRPELYESMGQFLQQVNIIRDVREDFDGGRKFWPREIWSKHVNNFEDLFKDEYQEQALNCSSEMIHNALRRADECLFYLAGMRDQSVFNFAAIPQSMAIATLELCFRNPDIFKRNVKITRGQACQLMLASTQNVQVLYRTFRKYSQKLLKKNKARDPSFLNISIACGKIEQFTEKVFPSQTPGPRAVSSPEQERLERLAREEAEESYYLFGSAILTFFVLVLFMIWVGWMAGARFDLAWKEMRDFSTRMSSTKIETKYHEEL